MLKPVLPLAQPTPIIAPAALDILEIIPVARDLVVIATPILAAALFAPHVVQVPTVLLIITFVQGAINTKETIPAFPIRAPTRIIINPPAPAAAAADPAARFTPAVAAATPKLAVMPTSSVAGAAVVPVLSMFRTA